MPSSTVFGGGGSRRVNDAGPEMQTLPCTLIPKRQFLLGPYGVRFSGPLGRHLLLKVAAKGYYQGRIRVEKI